MQQESSYLAHQANIQKIPKDNLSIQQNKDSFGYRWMTTQLQILAPFLTESSSWLTIGDLYGLEAQYLNDHGQKATASDLSDAVLKQAKELGLIQQYATINVESIPFSDNHFDYCLCKEAYHHFPRAYLGLYEMIRVSAKATILIEPIDPLLKIPTLLWLKNILDKLSPQLINRIWKNRFSFESVGNYVFKLSEREVEKVAMGLGLRCIAFRGVNFSYAPIPSGVFKGAYSEKTWAKYNRWNRTRNLLSQIGILPYNVLCAVIFKEEPSSVQKKHMTSLGFQILDLPKNPYL